MLRDKRNDLLYLLTILESLEKVISYGRCGDCAEAFYRFNDQVNFNAVLTLLLHTGEIVAKLSDDLVQSTPDTPWEKVRGLRNRIAHDYMGLDIAVIYKTIKEEVPELLDKIYQTAAQRIETGILDKEELRAAQGNYYYRHIRFDRLGAK